MSTKRNKLKAADVLWTLFIAFLVIGVVYPIIGLIALICMLAPVVVGIIKGKRIWCSNYCPRGSFLGKLMQNISQRGKPPKFLNSTLFKTIFVLFLLSNFAIGIIKAEGNLTQIGFVFVRLIIITSIVGILLGVFYQPRTWCTICPMGTLSNVAIKGRKKLTSIEKKNDNNSMQHRGQCDQCPLKDTKQP
ncbi:4Fe-4S binding domain-containing protein [Natronincola peptidivorans]|uniref:4Fe-4S binding domain-containing protein n=1 Tax=Natronincola peptidivorans TaxID=426128 RepID=A0A1I0EHG9_9FIRM|nr:4Fe-4S binding protein [Natronincola peptidivorans]SET44834.1 4Fe-4S binding domain-containing protein [Natronincola peptidivorans]